MNWPDPHLVLKAGLEEHLDGIRIGTRIPADLEQIVSSAGGYIRIIGSGGADDSVTDRSNLDVEIFGPDFASASRLAGRVRKAGEAISGRIHGSALIDTSRWISKPFPVDYKNIDVERFIGIIELTFRRRKEN